MTARSASGRSGGRGVLGAAPSLRLGRPARPAAGAPRRPGPTPARRSSVVEVSGLLDPVLVDFVETHDHRGRGRRRDRPRPPARQPGRRGRRRPARRAWSSGSRRRACPVASGSGRPGSQASGEAPRARRRRRRGRHRARQPDRDHPGAARRRHARRRRRASGDTVSAERGRRPRAWSTTTRPTIGDFVVSLDGVRDARSTDGEPPAGHRRPGSRQLPLVGQLIHTVASPPVAYLLFVIGMALLLFELFTAGVGVAGRGRRRVPRARLLRPGRPAHPTRSGVALLVFAMFGFARRRADRRAPGLDRHRDGRLRGRVAAPLRRRVAVVDHAARRHRRHGRWPCRRACRPWSAAASPRPPSGGSG